MNLEVAHRLGGPCSSQIIGSPGHVTSCFSKFWISKNSVFNDQEFFPKIHKKSSKTVENRGAAPLPPTQVGAKCLAAVVLDNQGRAHSLCPLRSQSLSSFSDSDFFSEDSAPIHTQSSTTALPLVEVSHE